MVPCPSKVLYEHRSADTQPAHCPALGSHADADCLDTKDATKRFVQIQLKRLLPFCDVHAIVTSCPRLVLKGDWPVVVEATHQLRTLYTSEDDIAALVQQNPVILHQDVQYVVSELQRYVPDADCSVAVKHQLDPQSMHWQQRVLTGSASSLQPLPLLCLLSGPVAITKQSSCDFHIPGDWNVVSVIAQKAADKGF